MSQAAEALVTVLHGKFWGGAGEGTRYLGSGKRPKDLRDVAIDLTTMLADEVARVMEAVNSSSALRSELDRIEALPQGWGEEHLVILKASLIASGVL